MKNKPQLSELELNILTLIAKGYSTAEIAVETKKTEHIIKDNKKSIYSKFNVNKNVQAVVKAIYHKILNVEDLVDENKLPREKKKSNVSHQEIENKD